MCSKTWFEGIYLLTEQYEDHSEVANAEQELKENVSEGILRVLDHSARQKLQQV